MQMEGFGGGVAAAVSGLDCIDEDGIDAAMLGDTGLLGLPGFCNLPLTEGLRGFCALRAFSSTRRAIASSICRAFWKSPRQSKAVPSQARR